MTQEQMVIYHKGYAAAMQQAMDVIQSGVADPLVILKDRWQQSNHFHDRLVTPYNIGDDIQGAGS